MSKRSIEGFLSNPFFVALKAENKPKDIESILNLSIQNGDNENYFYLINAGILDEYLHRHNELTEGSMFREEYQGLVQEILLEYFVEEDCLKYFLDYDENTKVLELIKRKQYNAKLIKQALNRIAFFISRLSSGSIKNTDIPLILDRDIKRRISEYNDNYVLTEMKPLKVIADKVASGVKTECYLDFDKGYLHSGKQNNDIDKSLSDYILSKHGYKYYYDMSIKSYNYSLLFGFENDDKVLSLAVVNDENFWIFNGQSGKTFLTFVYIVAEHNGLRHAEKLIDYAFDQACKNPICKYLYENKLSLSIPLHLQEKMIDWCVHRLNMRLSSVTTNKIEEADYNGFLYPMFDGYENQVLRGKEIFVEFIKKAYPDISEKIFEIFQNPQIVIQDETRDQINRIQKRLLTLETMLESEYLGFGNQSEIKKFLYGFYKNYGTVDSILGRMYYRCYIIDKLTDKISNECLYEVFFDIFQMIESKFGIPCSYTINHELGDKNYILLKKILRNYGFELSDTYKHEYITALLDRKYASFDEVELFPQLEQYGDAIYELAVDNIFFYNPETTLNHQNRESLVKAKSQIKISKILGLNKLY
ncbi:MAG: hypothetical protein K2J85_05550, partial [Anaeroplasmataceae bacterium]|nr:hypothetical protein [Anaeroplasmataceae bacterium]